MRQLVASFVVIGCFASQSAAVQSSTKEAATPAIRACSLLTGDVVTQVTPYDKAALDLVMRIPPQEDSVGSSGSACSYGGITMQVDPFTPAVFEKQRGKDWVPIAGVGDTAYFFDRRGRWAELYVRVGEHVLTIQMDIPMGRTAATVQPNVVALARAILPKLR
jgi:hypothetical protein